MGLKQKSISGVFWTGIGTFGGGFVSFIIIIVLSRLLEPKDFGQVELLLVFTTISSVFVDSGFSQALIRDNLPSDKDFSTVFYLNLLIGVILYIILYFIAPKVAVFFNSPSLTILGRITFLIIVFDSSIIVQNAIFSRNLNFKPYSIASILSIVIAGAIAIGFAMNDYGVWSIVINLLLVSFLRMVFIWYQSLWRPTLDFSYCSVKKYFRFGSSLLIQGVFDKVMSNMESFIIGRNFTKETLGYFSQSKKFNSYINQTALSLIQKVSYPTLSSIKDEPKRLKNGINSIIGITLVLFLPLSFFTFAASNELIYIVFGEKWMPSAMYLKMWSIWAVFYPMNTISVNLLLVKGESRIFMILSLIKQSLRFIVIILLVKKGIIYMMIGIISVAILSAIVYSIVALRLIGYSFSEFVHNFRNIVVSSLFSLVIVISLTNLFECSIVKMFFVKATVMVSVYTFLSFFVFKNIYIRDLLNITSYIMMKLNKLVSH